MRKFSEIEHSRNSSVVVQEAIVVKGGVRGKTEKNSPKIDKINSVLLQRVKIINNATQPRKIIAENLLFVKEDGKWTLKSWTNGSVSKRLRILVENHFNNETKYLWHWL